MKRCVLISLLMLAWNATRAQTVHVDFGVRFEGIASVSGEAGFPVPGIQLGLETRADSFAVGVRASLTSVVVAWHPSIDLYASFSLEDGTTLYAGLGWGYVLTLFSGSQEDWHVLLGARFAGGFFLEVTPGVVAGTVCRYGPMPQNARVQPQTAPCNSIDSVRGYTLGVTLGWVWTVF